MVVGISDRKKVALLSFCGLCTSLLLTAYTARHPEVARFPSTVFLEIAAPVHAAIDFIEDSARGVWRRYLSLIGVAEENNRLRARMAELEGLRGTFDEFKLENQRLRNLLELRALSQLQGVAADVIGDEPSGWGQGIVINRGSSHRVRVGMAVVHPKGVVGQVVGVSPNFSQVLLVTDHASGIDVMTQDARVRGVVEGIGADHCELKFVAKETPIRIGDVVVTSGMDGVFPKGVPVGVVSRVAVETGTLLQNIEVGLAVDFHKLEEVLVVTGDSDARERSEEAKALVSSSGALRRPS